MAWRSLEENLGPNRKVQYSRRGRISSGVKPSAASCKACGSATVRKALSFLRKPMPLRSSTFSMKLWPFEPVGGLKGKEGSHAQDYGTQHFIVEVEIIVGEAAALLGQDAKVGVLGGITGYGGAKGVTLLHTFENEIHPMFLLPLHVA